MVKQDLPSIDIVLDEARRALDFQFEQLDGLDTKASIVLGIAGVVFTIVLTNLLLVEFAAEANLHLAKAALVPISLAFVLSIVKLWIKKYKKPPSLERLRSYYIAEDLEKTKLRIIDVYLKAVDDNAKLLNYQVWLVKCSYILLSIGLGLLTYWIWGII